MVPHPRGGEWEHRQRQQWRWQGEPGGQGGKFWMAIGSEEVQSAFFRQQMDMVLATLYLSLKICWPKPNWADKLEERCLGSLIRFLLITIHPNPGPGRDKTEEGKKRRREGRYQKRKDKREARLRREGRKSVKKKYSIVTWNVQRMSLRDYHKRKARRVAEYVKNLKWDAVLLSELLAERPGVVWLGEGEDLTAIIHSEKAGVLLRGELLEGWNREGQKKKVSERSVDSNLSPCVHWY